mmetsp:Transcript_89633/g.182810  ORF Transcript_89633/g.182810 Transcript_89633/m.182810 type:complete len:313 (+) Transcript_89633:19-957(+)
MRPTATISKIRASLAAKQSEPNNLWVCSPSHVAVRRLEEEVLKWAKHMLEGRARDGQHLSLFAVDDDVRRTRLVLEERQLSEVVSCLILRLLASTLLRGMKLSILHYVKFVAWIILLHHGGPLAECLDSDRIRDLRTLIGPKRAQDAHLLQEGVVLLPPFGGRILDNVVEGVTVQLPADARFLRNDRCCSWAVVEQGEFPKDIAGVHGLHHLFLAVDALGTVKRPRLDDKKIISIFALLDDLLVLFEVDLLHGHDDNLHILILEVRKHEALPERAAEPLALLCALSDNRCHKRLLDVERSVGLGAHGRTALL